MKTNRNIASGLLAALVLVSVILACKGTTSDETEKANKLVDEGNAAIAEGKKILNEAEDKKNTMLHTNVAQLGEARTLANEAIRDYDQAEEKCKDAAAKYDEASKLKTDDKFKEYLSLKVKEYNKRAEMVEAMKATPQALIDSQTRAAFVSRANAANEKATRLGKEADDLSAQADKIQKDNPQSFKKS